MLNNSLRSVQAQVTKVRAEKAISDKPLDFSHLKLTDINMLLKEQERTGRRRPIIDSEDEEENKKVSYKRSKDFGLERSASSTASTRPIRG